MRRCKGEKGGRRGGEDMGTKVELSVIVIFFFFFQAEDGIRDVA